MDRKASIPSINLFRESAESPQEGLPKKMAGSKYHHSHTGYECQTEPEKILQQDSIYPEALEHVIRKDYKDFKGDIIVTENGVAVSDNARRVEFIRRALAGVESCLHDRIPVKGYCYWSLMDNFEWQKGFSMTFGLIAVDRSTQTRIPKQSLSFLGCYAG